MTWTRIDDGFLDHPKVLRAGEDAANLYLRALVWCNKHLTDGHVPRDALRAITSRRGVLDLVGRLVEVGLWEVNGTEGWFVHDFLVLNPARADVLSRRDELSSKRAAAGRSGGVASGKVRKEAASAKQDGSNDEATAKQLASFASKQNEAPSRPVQTSPDPEESESTHAHAHTREEPRCGTVERPNAPKPDEVEAVLVRGGGRKLDLRATATLKIHLRRAFVELGYPLAAWEALGRQIGTSTEALWPSDFLRALLARSGGKVTVAFLLGRKLDGADPAACGYDCAPLTEAFGRLAQLRPQEPAQGPQKPRGLPPPIPLASVGSAALGRAAMAAAMAATPTPEEHPRG